MEESKFIDLEIKIAYMEKTIDDLSKIIMDQQSQLTELSKKLEEVDEKVKSGEHGEITNPPPPHH